MLMSKTNKFCSKTWKIIWSLIQAMHTKEYIELSHSKSYVFPWISRECPLEKQIYSYISKGSEACFLLMLLHVLEHILFSHNNKTHDEVMKICHWKTHVTQKHTFSSKLRSFSNVFLTGVMKICCQKAQMQHESFFYYCYPIIALEY